MHKEDKRLIIEPAEKKSLLEALAELGPVNEDFPPVPDTPPDPVDL